MPPWQGRGYGRGGDPRDNWTKRAARGLVEGGVVPLPVHQVERPIEQRPPACRRHRQLVDRCVRVALRLQVGLGDAATPGGEDVKDDGGKKVIRV